MKKLLFWIITVVTAVVLVALAIDNRDPVQLSLDPFPWAIVLPLYGFLFAAGLFGLIVGMVAQWWIGRRWRREARLRRRENADLVKQLAELKAAASRERAPTAELLAPHG